ncbi:MAG: ATP-binding protein [Actinoplanes sp.]
MPGRGEWTLVGRDDELKTIEDVVSAQMPGLVLVGDAGVGKTRLLREALARAGEDGVECHWVSATGAARSIPFGAVSHLIPASRRPSADAVGLVATVERDFARRGGGRPVMIGIDDAHLLDEPSAGLLHQLAVHGLAVAVATVRAGDYDNYARTGYGTGDIIAGRAGPDACGNGWGRVASPLGLATARIAKAKADGHNAYHATTGGVNNTNWNTVLTRLSICRALEFAGESLNPTGLFRFEWAAVGGKQGIVTNGGGCNFWLDLPVGEDYYINIAVPRYTGPAQYAGITADATTIVNSLLGAGADKVVWMCITTSPRRTSTSASTAGSSSGRSCRPGCSRTCRRRRSRRCNRLSTRSGWAPCGA